MGEIERILTGDGQVVVDLPEHEAGRIRITINRLSADDVRIVIAPVEEKAVKHTDSLTRDEARQRLALAQYLRAPQPSLAVNNDYDFTPVTLPPGSAGSEILVAEDRQDK